jgi:hypothetical protein
VSIKINKFGQNLTDLCLVYHLKGDPFRKSNFRYTTVHITLYRKVTAFILVLKDVSDEHSVNNTKDVNEYFLHISLDILSQLRHRLPLKYYTIKYDKELHSL